MGSSILFTILYVAGAIQIVYGGYRLFSFTRIYLRATSLHKYQLPGAYAVVTGASDGIGKAIAVELAKKGFNLVLHGRNESKLKNAENAILARNSSVKVIRLVQDGSKDPILNVAPIRDLPITVLVNNVGIGPTKKFTNLSRKEMDDTINLNIFFPTHLTNALLPHLSTPSLLLNVSSYAGLYPPPYLAVYAGTKAYNNAFSQSLSVELEDVETISLITGSVHTGSNKKPVSFFRPTSEKYAQSVLSIVGCGKKSVMPYWPHAVQTWLLSFLPDALTNRAMKSAMQKELNNSIYQIH